MQKSWKYISKSNPRNYKVKNIPQQSGVYPRKKADFYLKINVIDHINGLKLKTM